MNALNSAGSRNTVLARRTDRLAASRVPLPGLLAASLVASAGVLASCASSGSGSGAAPSDAGVHVHANGAADAAEAVDLAMLDETPIAADKATLYVEGLSCPACATNVDHQLKDVQGVRFVEVDLGDGTVDLTLGGSVRPSRATLARAIHDSGFTLRRIEVGQ